MQASLEKSIGISRTAGGWPQRVDFSLYFGITSQWIFLVAMSGGGAIWGTCKVVMFGFGGDGEGNWPGIGGGGGTREFGGGGGGIEELGRAGGGGIDFWLGRGGGGGGICIFG